MKTTSTITQPEKTVQYGYLKQERLFGITPRTCANPGCEREVIKKNKKYCCDTCRAEGNRKKKAKEKQLRNDGYKKQLNNWIRENPTAYNAMLEWCKNDYKLGIVRISTKWLIEQARRRMKIKWNNSWTSLLARRLIEDAKEIYDIDLTDVIELRKRILEE